MGRLRKPAEDVLGKTFNYLTPKEEVQYDRRYWKCDCYCGKEVTIRETYILNGHTKSCGCEGSRAKIQHLNCKPAGESARNSIYGNAKNHAKKRKIKFILTKEEYFEIAENNCYYCNQDPKDSCYKNANGNIKVSGIDRVDSSKGYENGNCVPCCKYCNAFKLELPQSDFYLKAKQLVENLKKKGLT